MSLLSEATMRKQLSASAGPGPEFAVRWRRQRLCFAQESDNGPGASYNSSLPLSSGINKAMMSRT
jgi:hypothetical protein